MQFTQKFFDAVSDLNLLIENSPIKEDLILVREHFKLDGEIPETGINVVLKSPNFKDLLSNLEFRGFKIFVELQEDKIKTQTSIYYSRSTNELKKVDVFDGDSADTEAKETKESKQGWLDAHNECW